MLNLFRDPLEFSQDKDEGLDVYSLDDVQPNEDKRLKLNGVLLTSRRTE